ncbi:MAG: hypothetical protein Q7U75_19980 [Desulfobacterales bacterium]|nr:hypothetical protein [Desulfobacterales bacterium]
MNTRETLILKALEFKNVHTGSSIGGLVDQLLAQNPDQADAITKNVCARIPVGLAEEMEQIGGLIGLNKREIITMAIVDFLEKAQGVMDEFNAWPGEHTGDYEVTAVEPVFPLPPAKVQAYADTNGVPPKEGA